jgi:hypothetical protein
VVWDAYIDATSAIVNLPIAEEYRPGVAAFLQLAADMAAVLERVDLDDGELALAAIYLPPEIRDRADE